MLNKNLLKENPTNAEVLGFAMEIKDQEIAHQYFNELVQYHMKRWNVGKEEAERSEKSNLGYYSGYYNEETRIRVQKLFNCEHPIFGKIE